MGPCPAYWSGAPQVPGPANGGLPGNGVQVASAKQRTLDKIDKAAASFPPGTTLADAMKGYIGSISSGEPHNESENVEKLFGDYVMEKYRKQQERRK